MVHSLGCSYDRRDRSALSLPADVVLRDNPVLYGVCGMRSAVHLTISERFQPGNGASYRHFDLSGLYRLSDGVRPGNATYGVLELPPTSGKANYHTDVVATLPSDT